MFIYLYVTEPEACYGQITNTDPVVTDGPTPTDPTGTGPTPTDPTGTGPEEDPTSGCNWLHGSSLKAAVVIALILAVIA